MKSSSQLSNQGRVAEIPRVAFQGEPGAFSEMAIGQYWPAGAVSVPCHSFSDALELAVGGQCDFAIIPVENSIAGLVRAGRDALSAAGAALRVVGETSLEVKQCLMALPGAAIRDIRVVESHPVALAQCGRFLAAHPAMHAVPHADTAGAAHDVSVLGDPTRAAIAAALAAQHYGLEILARDIQDEIHNYTRFLVLEAAARTARIE